MLHKKNLLFLIVSIFNMYGVRKPQLANLRAHIFSKITAVGDLDKFKTGIIIGRDKDDKPTALIWYTGRKIASDSTLHTALLNFLGKQYCCEHTIEIWS